MGKDRIREQGHKSLHRRACERGSRGRGVRRRWHVGEVRKAGAGNLVLIRWRHALGGISSSWSVRIHWSMLFTCFLMHD